MQCGLKSQLVYIYIYMYKYMSRSVTLSALGATHGGQARVQDGVVPVTWMPPLYFWHTKDQRSGQIDHFFLPRYAYYSSNTIRVCVVSVSVEI